MSTKQSNFIAWFSRMPNISRWGLMRTSTNENISEHSHQVAVIAHLLVVIKNVRHGGNLNPDKATSLAVFHEASETRLMDIPYTTKYLNPELTKAFKQAEHQAEVDCVNELPEDLRSAYAELIIQEDVDPAYKTLVKNADNIAALITALVERHSGNREFDKVIDKQRKRIEAVYEECPEVRDFMNEFCDACTATVDELL